MNHHHIAWLIMFAISAALTLYGFRQDDLHNMMVFILLGVVCGLFPIIALGEQIMIYIQTSVKDDE